MKASFIYYTLVKSALLLLLAFPLFSFNHPTNTSDNNTWSTDPDSLKQLPQQGHLMCTIHTQTNCVTKEVTLEAWTEYTFTGQSLPVVVAWSTGESAHKIMVTPPGIWSWDVSGIGCEVIHQFNTITFDHDFFTGPLSIDGPVGICPPEPSPLTVNANGYAGFSAYEWDPASSMSSPNWINQEGLYALTVTDAFGCTFTDQITVSNSPPTTASFTYSANHDTVSFTNTSVNATNFSWDFGDGQTSTLTDPSTIFGLSGFFNVCLNATGSCEDDTCQVIQVSARPSWIVDSTGRNHSIILPENLQSNILGIPMELGDYIGMFYDDAGTLKCGGYGIWNGQNTSFAVFGNDAQAPAKNGFDSGELFQVKVWKTASNTEISVSAQYAPIGSLQGLVTHTNAFDDDGLSLVNWVTTAQTHAIALSSGWNLISSYIMPDERDMLDVFEAIALSVDIVKDGDGAVTIPSPLLLINQIGDWNLQKGYQVKANQVDTLFVLGQKVVPENNPIALKTGWQIISYLRNSPMDIETVFSAIQGQISLVKDNLGNVYAPQFGINTIGDMQPGQGYKVKALSNINLLFSANFTNPNVTRQESSLLSGLEHFVLDSNFNTGNNAIIILTDAVADPVLDSGDEIGVFTPAGVLCGAAKYTAGSNLAITVWGDDTSTGSIFEGMQVGEAYYFRVWDSTQQVECVAITELVGGTNAYMPDAFEVIESMMLCKNTENTLVETACGSFVLNNQTYTASGSYTQMIPNAAGCDSIITLNLTINPFPNIILDGQAICFGESATMTASGAASYLWSTGETTTLITVIPDVTTTYSVVGTTAGCSATATIEIEVSPLPLLDLGPDIYLPVGQDTLLDASCACQFYLWSTGDTLSSILVNTMGTYTVMVTGTNGCTASDSVAVILTSGINDLGKGFEISVSPNPAHDLLHVTCTGSTTTSVAITDNLGKVLRSEEALVPDGATRTISLNKIPPGIYYLRIVGQGFVKSVPIIKDK